MSWKKIFKKAKLSEGIAIKRELVSPSGERAMITNVKHELGLSMLTTVVVNGQHFDLEIRSQRVFDEMFKDWEWIGR